MKKHGASLFLEYLSLPAAAHGVAGACFLNNILSIYDLSYTERERERERERTETLWRLKAVVETCSDEI
jgi:hypothetical protein